MLVVRRVHTAPARAGADMCARARGAHRGGRGGGGRGVQRAWSGGLGRHFRDAGWPLIMNTPRTTSTCTSGSAEPLTLQWEKSGGVASRRVQSLPAAALLG